MSNLLAMCAATIGYLAGPAGPALRALLLATGALLFFPSVAADAAGAALLAAILLYQWMRRPAPAVEPVSRTVVGSAQGKR